LNQEQKHILKAAIESLLDESKLEHVVACAASSGLDGSDVPICVSLLHVRFNEDLPQEDALAKFLWQQCFMYALPRKRRIEFQKKLSENIGDLTGVADIFDRVRNIFIKFRKDYPYRASEVGEVLAYSVAVSHLKAAQMAAKMSLKTSANMPVHGLDGIHAAYENGALTIYFLESKLSKSASDGAADYADSVASFLKNEKQYLREYEIVGDLGNLDVLQGEARELALQYFDIVNEPQLLRRERSVGVICYTEDKHFSNTIPVSNGSPDIHEKHFASNYSSEMNGLADTVIKNLVKKGANPKKCTVFFVAVPNVNALREKFYTAMGLPDVQVSNSASLPMSLGNNKKKGA
jgi:hypothetical protein